MPSATRDDLQKSISPYLTLYFSFSACVAFVLGSPSILEYILLTMLATPRTCTLPSFLYASLFAKNPLLTLPRMISVMLTTGHFLAFRSGSPNSSINRDWQSANVFSMRNLHIVLIHHCVLHCGVNFGMAEEPLHLFYRHSFVDGACCQRSSEFMWMHLCDAEPTP